MNVAALISPRAWRDRAVEAVWRLAPGLPADPVTFTWPVDREVLQEVRVRWPRVYQWPPRAIIGEQLYHGLRRFVAVERVELAQPYQGCIVCEVVVRGRARRVVFETKDYADLEEPAYQDADLHFKMEFRLGGYGARDRLLPGGYVSADRSLYTYLPRLRRMRDELPPRWEVYGRYGLSLEKRQRPLEILRDARAFTFYGGAGKVRYSAYLREMARASICIDLPSMSSIPFRVIDLLAVGSCAVGPPHTNQLLMPLQDGVHVTYCRSDYSDLEEVCAELLADQERQRRLIANSRAFFNAYVHRDQQTSYYLQHCLARLG